MPPARRRQRPVDPDDAVAAMLRALRVDVQAQETPEARAVAAHAHMRRLEAAHRALAIAREDAVAELLHGGKTLRSVARALDITVNAVVQIREMRLTRLRARGGAPR